jgi:Leucine-rich repeat (LRR) protein
MWNQQLGRAPDWMWLRTDLEVLVLADNGLTYVSARIGDVTHLRMLDLGHNRLTRLPEVLGALACLTDFLYLHDNQLTSLPSLIRQLTALHYLNISDNAFDVLPGPVCEMTGLSELRAEANHLESLPESIGQLTRLRELSLRNNSLTSLPD